MCYKREFDYYECSGCGCWKECYGLAGVKRLPVASGKEETHD